MGEPVLRDLHPVLPANGRPLRRAWVLALAAPLLALTAAACGGQSDSPAGAASSADAASSAGSSAGETSIAVTSSDDACEVALTEAPSGTVTFTVTNTGSAATEFYLYGEDGQQIVGEVENIGPGLSRDLVVTVEPGTYQTACKPGMVGEGIRADFTVTGG